MKAVVIDKGGDSQRVSVRDLGEEALGDGDVTVRVEYSTLNYKDGLAITGNAPVVRRFPMVPGIDFAGTVERSDDPRFRTGDAVVLNGWGVGEKHFGGYAEKARVRGDWLVPLPKPLSARQAMAIGTAGYTAMLAVMALERHGVAPAGGPAVVTGAAGGVGSIATTLLAQAGWHVVSVTGRTEEAEYLKSLGAKEVVPRDELTAAAKPLARERWAAGVDSVGSTMLANLLSMTKYGGAIAACGLAAGMDLPASVAPFILRGVALLGVDSVMAPRGLRLEAWQRLARTLDLERLESMVSTIALEDVIDAAARIVQGKVRGRLVVAVAN